MSDENLDKNESDLLKQALNSLDPVESQKGVNAEYRIEDIKRNVTLLFENGKQVKLTQEMIDLGLRDWFMEMSIKYEAYYRINKLHGNVSDEKTYF